jgi:hypothetical protein
VYNDVCEWELGLYLTVDMVSGLVLHCDGVLGFVFRKGGYTRVEVDALEMYE